MLLSVMQHKGYKNLMEFKNTTFFQSMKKAAITESKIYPTSRSKLVSRGSEVKGKNPTHPISKSTKTNQKALV